MRVITFLINASSTNITCNHLNLPTSILWGTAKKIDIVYDAVGGQLSRTVYTGAVVDYKQDYAAGVEYRTVGSTRKLESLAHAEGRRYNVNVNTGTSTESLRLEYSIRDHLGNNRLTFTDKNSNGKIDVTTTSTNEILSEQHYYSFGLSYGGNLWMNEAGDVDNRYLYNGKELMGDHGLGWYNYGARWYDPAIGRWNAVDPLVEKYLSWSPYNYVLANPIRLIDPDGKAVDDIVVPNKEDRAAILKMINSKAAGSFRFDDNGKLYQYESGAPETGSTYYAERLAEAIEDSKTIYIGIAQKFNDNGTVKDIDTDAGGGVTQSRDQGPMMQNRKGGDQLVLISGNENTKLKDTEGNPLEDKAADILAHELVGHAIPHILGSDTGNAVGNENKVRSELNGKKRAAEPNYKE